MGINKFYRPLLCVEGVDADSDQIDPRLLGVPRASRWHSFLLRMVNTGGTIQHRITSVGDTATASNLVPHINNASTTLQNTPTGANASTAMVGALKIDGVNDHVIHFDTVPVAQATLGLQAALHQTNNGTTHPSIFLQTSNIDINGVTRVRLSIQFHVGATGIGWGINGTNLGVGQFVDVNFQGFMEEDAS